MNHHNESPVAIKNHAVYVETELAILVARDGMDERSVLFKSQSFWIPKSMLLVDEGNELNSKDDAGILIIYRWLADKHDLQWEYVA